MKTRTVLAALAFCAALSSSIPGQTASTRLLRLTYMKVEPARASDYIQRIRAHYIPIQNRRAAEGKIVSWKAYQVGYPNGDGDEYNFVLAVELSGYARLEPDGTYAETAKKVAGADKHEQVLANPIAKTIRTDTFVIRDATQGWSAATNRLLNAYLKALPGKAEELMAIQRGHYLPSTEDSVRAGRMASWAIATLRFPEDRERAYTHASIAGYESMAQIEKQPSAEHREKWRAAAADAMAKLPAVRTRVKGELWRLIDQTTPGGTKRTT